MRFLRGKKERAYLSLNCHCIPCLNNYTEILHEAHRLKEFTRCWWRLSPTETRDHIRTGPWMFWACQRGMWSSWGKMPFLDSRKLLSKAIYIAQIHTDWSGYTRVHRLELKALGNKPHGTSFSPYVPSAKTLTGNPLFVFIHNSDLNFKTRFWCSCSKALYKGYYSGNNEKNYVT